MMRIQLSSSQRATMRRVTAASHFQRYARIPNTSSRHSTGSMIAAAATGEMTSERSGVDTPPAPPPMPPFEMPVRKTATTPIAQNPGSAISNLVGLDVGLLDELGVLA